MSAVVLPSSESEIPLVPFTRGLAAEPISLLNLPPTGVVSVTVVASPEPCLKVVTKLPAIN